MLSGQSISRSLARSELQFTGSVRGNALLLTLGGDLQPFLECAGLVVEPWREESINEGYEPAIKEWETYDLKPGHAVLAGAREFLHLPDGLVGIIGTLSHVARLGLFAHFASPLISPRFSGYICLELCNVSGHVLRLKQGMPVAKICLAQSIGLDPETGPGAIPSPYNTSAGVARDLRSRLFEEFGGEPERS